MVDLGETFYWTRYYNTDILDKDRVVKHSFAFILLQWRKEVAEFFIELILNIVLGITCSDLWDKPTY